MKIAKIAFIVLTLLLFAGQQTFAQKKKTLKKSPKKKEVVKVESKKPKVESSHTVNTESQKRKTDGSVNSKAVNEKLPPIETVQGEKKVRDIITVLEYMLNMLGSASTPSRDKDVLVTESYSKIFRDTKVQIEDDLDDQRNVITNKDVVPYLKDVDFFFTDARFEFIIDNIQEGSTGSSTFYKVSAKRNLKATTSDGETINKTIPRYIEINYDPAAQDLKIVSIYTNEFDEKRALTNWWNELSYEWKSFFQTTLKLQDSVSLSEILKISLLESIDLSNNAYIQNIDPLAQLTSLKILNLSKTKVKDLTPLRNLTTLTELYLSHTPVQDLSPLKYSNNLKRLAIDHTLVYDITVLEKMPFLEFLTIANIQADDFSPIASLPELTEANFKNTKLTDLNDIKGLAHLKTLNIANTPIQDLSVVAGLKELETLTIDSTRIKFLFALSTSENLKTLYANNTLITDLTPLAKLVHLEKVYVDQSNVNRESADTFMNASPTVLVIYNSAALTNWWHQLSPEWQKILEKGTKQPLKNTADGNDTTPTKEDLANITAITDITLTGSHAITSLEPLNKLYKLRVLNAEKISISDLTPLHTNKNLVYLNISETEVHDLSPLGELLKLEEIHADKTKIETIAPLYSLPNLKKLYVDQTAIHDITAYEFLEKNSDCLLIYKTIHLNRWWSNLPPSWKDVFHAQMASDTTASRENLHQLTQKKKLYFKNASVHDLAALVEFVQLRELHFSETAIREIPGLENIKLLTSLHATNSPLDKIDALNKLTALQDLDLSNTPVYDLKAIGSLKNLKTLNCAGTQIKKLTALEELKLLESFDCSNTNVSNLDPILYVPLKTLKCYNTKISKREIESFKKVNTGCEVIYYR